MPNYFLIKTFPKYKYSLDFENIISIEVPILQETVITAYQGTDRKVGTYQLDSRPGAAMTQTMEPDKTKPNFKRPDVLKKLNTESLFMIERGLLGDLPEKLKPQPFIPRGRAGRPTDLQVAKHPGLLSSCLPVVESESERNTPSDDEGVSPLKKSFSFRDKFSRISFLGKSKDKPKWKTIEEKQNDKVDKSPTDPKPKDHEYKSNKRFWFFRKQDMERQKSHSPIYQRSKSFEFLPRAIEEEEETQGKKANSKRSSLIFENDSMGDAWTSNDSLEYISNVYYDKEDGVFLKSIREFPSESSHTTSMSTVSSSNAENQSNQSSSNIPEEIFQRESVQDLLEKFNKAVDLFSENYLSDCEPYTKTDKITVDKTEKRKSNSFATLPSPKVLKVNKMKEVSDDFKKELTKALSNKAEYGRRPRRGSVTDWFVLEEGSEVKSEVKSISEANKYRRGKKKPINRVRRMSSTKYWITPEECAVYSREQRPPLVIPRITQYRPPRQRPPPPQNHNYAEDTALKSSLRQYERLDNWSPTSERGRVELERSFSKACSDSPPFNRINKRLGGSTENLLVNPRRPHHLQLPPSSSGDSLDVEIRDKDLGHVRTRKTMSMVGPKHRLRSPVPTPRVMVSQPAAEASVLLEGPVKRTKFFEGGKKSKKNWNDCYMVLTHTALYFYKDQRTYYASKVAKPAGTPPSPSAPRAEMVLALRNARVLQCMPMHTRRHNRSLVLTVDYDQYLIQDETEEGTKRWLQAIQNVIYSLYPPMTDSPTPQYQSSNTDLESLGRTPPVSRHTRTKQKAGGSSNEDLSDSTEVSIQKSHVRSRLRKFFAKRPAMEVLVKKGIYKDEPVFGRNLEEVCPTTSPRVPEFVVACVKEIESSEENMCTDGLYRASGNLSQVQKIRLEIDQNHLSVIENNTDIHVLTGSLKLFFRELKEPLIPCSMFDRVLAACSIKPKEAKIKEFRDIIQSLPQCNRDTLKFLLEHLIKVTQYSERNRMHTANLAIVFGPTLLWAPAEQAHNIAVDCIQQNNVVDILLNEFKEIFPEDAKGKKKA